MFGPKSGLGKSLCSLAIFSDPVLQFLLAGLQEPRLSSVSAQALQSIASMCRDHMKSHFHCYCFRRGVTVPAGRTTRALSLFSVCPGTTEHKIKVP